MILYKSKGQGAKSMGQRARCRKLNFLLTLTRLNPPENVVIDKK
jgi:hypothetical protein